MQEHFNNGQKGRDYCAAEEDSAFIFIQPTSLVTTESGGTDTFSVLLTRQPTEVVTFPLESNNITEGTVSPTNLTFTAKLT